MSWLKRLFGRKNLSPITQASITNARESPVAQGLQSQEILIKPSVQKIVATVPQAQTESGLNALLMEACNQSQPDEVRRLVEAGANVNFQNPMGQGELKRYYPLRTPLHVACQGMLTVPEANTVSCAEYLIDCGAELNVRDRDGQTPLDVALNQRHARVAVCLLRKGADRTTVELDKIRRRIGTPYEWYGDRPMVDLLTKELFSKEAFEDCLRKLDEGQRAVDKKYKERTWKDWDELTFVSSEMFNELLGKVDSMTRDDLVFLLRQVTEAVSGRGYGHLNSLERRRQIAHGIGVRLHRDGGLEAMKRVLEVDIGSKPGRRTLEQFWDGIGEWRG